MTRVLALLQEEFEKAQKHAQQIALALAALKGGAKAPRKATSKKAGKAAKKHTISPAGLKRIRAAQKARWQKFHKQQQQGA